MKKKKVVISSKKTEKGAGAKILKLPAPSLPPPVVPAIFPPPLPEDPGGADPLPITSASAPTENAPASSNSAAILDPQEMTEFLTITAKAFREAKPDEIAMFYEKLAEAIAMTDRENLALVLSMNQKAMEMVAYEISTRGTEEAPKAKKQAPPKVAKPIIKGSVRRVRRGNMWVPERAPRGKRKK
jgi:hypothetical protein